MWPGQISQTAIIFVDQLEKYVLDEFLARFGLKGGWQIPENRGLNDGPHSGVEFLPRFGIGGVAKEVFQQFPGWERFQIHVRTCRLPHSTPSLGAYRVIARPLQLIAIRPRRTCCLCRLGMADLYGIVRTNVPPGSTTRASKDPPIMLSIKLRSWPWASKKLA